MSDPNATADERDDLAGQVADLKAVIKAMLVVLGYEGRCTCGAPVWWLTTKNFNRIPYRPDGIPHWADCPDAKKHRKKKGGG